MWFLLFLFLISAKKKTKMSVFRNYIFLIIMLLNGTTFLLSQAVYNNCASAFELCPNKTFTLNNINANKTLCAGCEDDFNFCFSANSTIWLKFKTNSIIGDVEVDFKNLNFEISPNQNIQLQATIISTSTPCIANSYIQIGNCVSTASSNFSLTATGLAANTEYYIIVSGDKSGAGITKAAECTFDVLLSGTAVDRITPTIEVVAKSYKVCDNELITVYAFMRNCKDSTVFTWSINGNTVAVTKDSIYQTADLKTGDIVSVSNSCYRLCSKTISISTPPFKVITIPVDAGVDQNSSSGQSVQLNGSTTAPVYSWSPDFDLSNKNDLTTMATPSKTTTYILTAIDSGCVVYDDMTVLVKEALVIPTTFSPNDDGVNDIFEIVGIENYPNCFLQIFNRLGQEVFQKSGYTFSRAWKGDYNGSDLSSGVYFYSLELRDSEKQIKKGTITLIR